MSKCVCVCVCVCVRERERESACECVLAIKPFLEYDCIAIYKPGCQLTGVQIWKKLPSFLCQIEP